MQKYWVVIDRSGIDTEPEIKYLTKKEIKKLEYPDGIAIFDGNIIKTFNNKFDKNKLK